MPRRPSAESVRRRLRVLPAAVAMLSSLLVVANAPGISPAAPAADWRSPVDGPVVGGFRVTPAAPYAAGQRRGIDLLARPGAPVRAACDGRVRFAGPVAHLGHVVTVRCSRGPWVATHGGLAATRAREGDAVGRGSVVGAAGPTGTVRLGARRDGDRHGYVDPRDLIGAPHATLPPAPRAPRRAPRPGPRTPTAPRPAAPPVPVAVPSPAAAPARTPSAAAARAPAGTPPVAWVALAVVAAAVPLGAHGRRRRARRTAVRAGRTAPGPGAPSR